MVYQVILECLKSKKRCALKEVLGYLYDLIKESHHYIEPEPIKNYIKNPPIFQKDIYCSCTFFVDDERMYYKLINTFDVKRKVEKFHSFKIENWLVYLTVKKGIEKLMEKNEQISIHVK